MSTPYNRTIQAIVIHHMGDGLPPSVSILQRWNPHGYDYPEYDFGIEADGTVRTGRPLTYQGAHCITDKPPYSARGEQWFNQHAVGIGLAGDFTKYPMSAVQFDALVALAKKLMAQYGLTLDDVYPHGQVTYTACPGATYAKVPALKGMWSYDAFEKAVMAQPATVVSPEKEETKVKYLVIYKYLEDARAAGYLADYLHCPVAQMEKQLDADTLAAVETVFQVGGTALNSSVKLISGTTAADTAKKVLDLIK